jgi:hypothetical protein
MPDTPRAERWGMAVWAALGALVILLPHLLHVSRYGVGAFPLPDGVDAPMYYVLAGRAPAPAEARTAYAHAVFADSGRPMPRRYLTVGALSWAASLVGLGGVRLLLLLDFVCPLAFFWLLNRWLRDLDVPAGIRLAACAWFVFCHTWFVQGAYFLLHWIRHGYGTLDVPFLHLNRPLNPQWSLLWYTGGLYLLWRHIQKPSWRLQAAAALCGLYATSIQGPFLGGPFWMAWGLAAVDPLRRRDWRIGVPHLLWLGLAAVLLAFWMRLERAPGHFLLPTVGTPPSYPATHAPLITIPVLGGWALAVLFLGIRPWKDVRLRWLLVFHVAVLLAVQQHVATGFLHHPDHFLRAMRVTLLLSGAVCLSRLSLRPRWGWLGGQLAGHAAAVLLLVNGIFVQGYSTLHARPDQDRLAGYREAVEWLSGRPPGVVAAGIHELTQTAVLLETTHGILYYGAAHHFAHPPREIAARWAFEHRLRGARSPDAVVHKAFEPWNFYDTQAFVPRFHRDRYGLSMDPYQDWLKREVESAIRGVWTPAPPFRVDYLLEGPFEQEAFGPLDPDSPFLKPVYPETAPRENRVRVYRVDSDMLRKFLAATAAPSGAGPR